jgi:hypothetical protein
MNRVAPIRWPRGTPVAHPNATHSYRTECSYADWVRRFFAYISKRQQVPHPCVRCATT